jgi:hypothetical protein
MPHYRLATPRRWAALTIATLLGLTCAALLLAGGRASAAPPDVPAPPPAALPGPAHLAPSAQLTPTICPRDVVVVLDRSGSMEYDPVCLGCWNRTATPNANDTPPYSTYYTYPSNGLDYTVPYMHTNIRSACYGENAYNTTAPTQPYSRTYGSYKYMIIEGEMYSDNNSTPVPAFREPGRGYWVMQRGQRNYPNEFKADSGSTSVVGDGRALYMAHMPDITYNMPGWHPLGQFYTASDAAAGNAPRLTYDITFPAGWGTGTSYLWVKTSTAATVGACDQYDLNHNINRSTFYWQLADTTDSTATAITTDTRTNTQGGGSRNWTWLRLGSLNPAHTYQFRIWAGSSGIGLDRLIVTNNPSTTGNDTSCSSPGNTIYPASGYNMGTAEVTAGTAHRAACDPCNPMYGEVVGPGTPYPTCTFYTTPVTTTDMLVASPIWRDSEAPLRSVKEAIKDPVRRLDPRYDQVGFVTYNDTAFTKTDLECLGRSAADGTACYAGASPVYSFTRILKAVEDADAQGGTFIASGMKAGLEVLGLNPYSESPSPAGPYGRGAAAKKILVLVTDGVPYPPNGANPGGLCTGDWYPYAGAPGAVSTSFTGDDANPDLSCPDGNCDGNDCMLWFAEDARAHGVALYTVGLGYAVNPDLLRETAERGNGDYYFSASGADLDLVLDYILSSATASCVPYGLAMAPDGAQSGLPGQSLVYTHTLVNQSYYPVTVTLSYSADPAGWPVGISPVSQTLEPGQAVTVTAVVTVPPGSMEGTAGVVRLVATLQGDEAISAMVVDRTTVGWSPSVYLPIILKSSQMWTQQ